MLAVTHKMTKRSLTQLTASLAEELQQTGLGGSIGVHNLSPGLVLTDLLLKDASPVARRFFNTLADEPEVVASVLVPRIRAVKGTGTSVEYLSPAIAVSRVLSGLPQILNGGRCECAVARGDRVMVLELGQQLERWHLALAGSLTRMASGYSRLGLSTRATASGVLIVVAAACRKLALA